MENFVFAAWKTPAVAYVLVFALAALVRMAYLAETADQPHFRMPPVDDGECRAPAKAWAAGARPLPKLAWQPWFYPPALAQPYALAGPCRLPISPARFRRKKRAAVAGRPCVSSLEKDYLLILRRRTIARAPRPSRLIVAGSGTGALTVMLLATSAALLLPPVSPA